LIHLKAINKCRIYVYKTCSTGSTFFFKWFWSTRVSAHPTSRKHLFLQVKAYQARVLDEPTHKHAENVGKKTCCISSFLEVSSSEFWNIKQLMSSTFLFQKEDK
jgi:hypothetical protein